ncbi:MAG: bifunctional metallophosphatase/5'-nucleotidase [Candidatus Gastranaerophilaceae bacterium]
MSIHYDVSGIKTWISPKIQNQGVNGQKTVEKQTVPQKIEQKLARVGAGLALATFCKPSLSCIKDSDKTMKNLDTKQENPMISQTMQAGKKGNVTSIFYVNDIHGRLSNMERITTASTDFDRLMPSYVDKLKLSAGDIMLGSNVNVNKAANSFLNANNFMASVVGNHEVDQNMGDFLASTKHALYKIMGSNAEMDKSHKLYNRIIDSYVQEDSDKNKYGIIALMPFDLAMRSSNKELFDGLEIEQKEETKKYLQQQIDDYKEKGVNRIIVLSHIGYENDIDIAKSVEGIDIIVGGHSHDLVEDVSVGENLIISKKTGAPTVITQAGRDGNYYGILNVEFNDDDEIVKAENIVKSTASLERSQKMNAKFNKILGKPEIIGNIKSSEPAPTNNLKELNPHVSMVADALKQKYNTDIALVNAGTVRGAFMPGEISLRDIGEIFPFADKLSLINVSEKELVETLKYSATSIAQKDGKPGLVQVAGMKYSVSKSGELVNLFVTDKNGKDVLIDINNPDESKTYSMALPSFIAKGLDGFTMLNKIDEPTTKLIDESLKDIAVEYIKNSPDGVEIKNDGRIKIV